MKKYFALSILCAAALSVPAHAEEQTGEHGKNYIGVSVSRLTAAPKSNGAAILLGHRYNENLAVELAYADSGALSNVAEKTSATSVAAIGFVPINSSFEVYGRLGYASAHTKNAEGLSANRGDVTYGLGIEYSLNENYSLGFGWDRVRVGDNVAIPRANENAYALTLLRSF